MIRWIKSLSIWAILGSIAAAVIVILNARREGRLQAEIDHAEEKIGLLNQGTVDDIASAMELQESITAKKQKAAEIRHKSEMAFERVGNDSETMADIATRFNGVRGRTTDTT